MLMYNQITRESANITDVWLPKHSELIGMGCYQGFRSF